MDACEKRAFRGRRSAFASVRTLHHTLHVYLCERCWRWHVAKRDSHRRRMRR